jgi:hypothetical protein
MEEQERRRVRRVGKQPARADRILFYFIFNFVRQVAIIHQRTYTNLATGQRGTWQIFRNPVYCPKSCYFTKKFPEHLPTLGHFRPHPNTTSTLPRSCIALFSFRHQVPSGENSAQADCDFKENSLKCSRLGPVTSKAMVFPFCLLFLSRHFLQRGVPTIFRLSFHTTKHSAILFSVRGGTLIFGNKTLSQREGSSAPTEGITLLSSFWGSRLWSVLPLL